MIVGMILASLAATLITYAVGIVLFASLANKAIRPANYYELQLPDIRQFIRAKGTALLEPGAREELETAIPQDGIAYQIVDAAARPLYGTLTEPVLPDRNELYERLNTTFGKWGHYYHTVPIIGEEGRVEGAAVLSYRVRMSGATRVGNLWVLLLYGILLLSPILYVILFTLLFSRLFANRVNRPLNMLMEAANKIKQKDLDFTIDYRADNELGRLAAAFSEMKEELARSLTAQWRLEQERVEMVEAIAHDLKTPLAVISAYAESLADHEPDDGERADADRRGRYLQVIRDNAAKAASLLRGMQDLSELDHAGPDVNVEPVPLRAFVERALSQYEVALQRRAVRLACEWSGVEAETRLSTDPDMLIRIIDNIMANSLRFVPEGGRIRVSVARIGDRVRFEIANNGPLFSPEALDKLFHRFYREDRARAGRDGHAGLGLYIVRRLAERLGGTVRAYNDESAGEACIAFELPLADER
jgi:signal transduction histidine kinase